MPVDQVGVRNMIKENLRNKDAYEPGTEAACTPGISHEFRLDFLQESQAEG